MPRSLTRGQFQKRSEARRAHALARLDLRQPSHPRENAVGPMSHAVKVVDAETKRLIREALAKRENIS